MNTGAKEIKQVNPGLNVAKCHSMRVSQHYSHKQIVLDYTLHQPTLENVQSTKYLGITITENMDWGQQTGVCSTYLERLSMKAMTTPRCGAKNSEYDQEISQSQTAGTARKSRSTITRHQENKLSKANSSLFPIKMIAILEWT